MRPMPAPTPGQVNFETYWRLLDGVPPFLTTWEQLMPEDRAAWEAAAEAVRAHRTMDTHGCPVCGARDLASRPPGLTEGGEVHRDMTCEDCAATWVNVYTYAETRCVPDTPHA